MKKGQYFTIPNFMYFPISFILQFCCLATNAIIISCRCVFFNIEFVASIFDKYFLHFVYNGNGFFIYCYKLFMEIRR